jgi:hypothetical protein
MSKGIYAGTALTDDLVNPGLLHFKNPDPACFGGHQMASAQGWTEPEKPGV